MLTWFDNPPRKRGGKRKSKSRKRPPKGYKSWSAWSRSMRARKKGGSKMAKRRKSRRKLYGAAAKAHARAQRRGGRKTSRRRSASRPRRRATWRRTSRAVARRAGRQLRYRRTNPPLRGIVGQLQQGAIDAGWIVAGKATSRIIAGFVPAVGGGQAVQIAIQAAAALAAGYVGRYISTNASRMMLAGGLSGVIESFVKQLNIPYVSAALGDGLYEPNPLAVGAYPQQGVSAYPQLLSGSDEDEDYYQ